jgi:ribosome-binding protein aMBF1 (putative translation factor)
MSRPFDNAFVCDFCGAHLDLEFHGMKVEIDGDVLDCCAGCVEDNEIKESA